MADYLSQLPFEVKANICAQLAASLSHDSRTRWQSLASLRLTCRLWSDSPLPQLFQTLEVPLWGPRGLRMLHAQSLRPHVARCIRSLSIRTGLYDLGPQIMGGGCDHRGAESFNPDYWNEEEILVPRCLSCYRRSHPLAQIEDNARSIMATDTSTVTSGHRGGTTTTLAELFRQLFSALPRQCSVNFILPWPIRNVNPVEELWVHGFTAWKDLSSHLLGTLISGFVSADTRAVLNINAPNVAFDHLFSRPSHWKQHLISTVSEQTFENAIVLGRLRLHSFDSIGEVGGSEDDVGPSGPSGGVGPHSKYLTTYYMRMWMVPGPQLALRLDYTGVEAPAFPQLLHLTLHSGIIYGHDLTGFLETHTPKLASLSLAGRLNLSPVDGDTWWDFFRQLRECSVKLTHFRLLGTRLLRRTVEIWYISPGHDPRPDPMGDGIEFDELERYILGEEMEDPWLKMTNGPTGRVMVWNAKMDEVDLMC
jgi:hypothetical protein